MQDEMFPLKCSMLICAWPLDDHFPKTKQVVVHLVMRCVRLVDDVLECACALDPPLRACPQVLFVTASRSFL